MDSTIQCTTRLAAVQSMNDADIDHSCIGKLMKVPN